MVSKLPPDDAMAQRHPEPDPPSDAAPAADLTAGLLRSAARPQQDPMASGDSPFFGKGGATADQFRRRHHEAHLAATLQPPTAPEPGNSAAMPMPRDIRLWLRVVPPLRWRMKLAAAVLGQTGQRFLVDALDDAMAQGLTAADDPLATPLPQDSAEARVKLAFWVDMGRRQAMRLATEARDETQQSFLHAALAAHLRRFAPSGLLLPAGDGAEVITFPKPSEAPLDGDQLRQRQALAAQLGFRVPSRNAS